VACGRNHWQSRGELGLCSITVIRGGPPFHGAATLRGPAERRLIPFAF
jgi:hypothetical protein